MNTAQLPWVALGGAIGAVLRVVLTEALPAGRWPWGTLAANLLGSLLMGLLMGKVVGSAGAASPIVSPFLVAGFCGGFTTFSAFSWQLFEQLRTGQWYVAVGYAGLTVATCLLATGLGWRLTRT